MFRPRRKHSDFSSEVEAHIQLEADRLEERGMSRKEAEAAARRAFGNVTAATERFYESGRWSWWDHFKQDVHFALRLMVKSPTLSAAILVTLALGIGANSVVYSVVRAVLLKPLVYEEPDRIVQVWEHGLRSGGESDWVSVPNFRDWQRENRVFEHMAAYRYALLTLTGNEGAEAVLGLETTDRLFAVLGVEPMLGRTFLAGEDKLGEQGVVVISFGLWQRLFGSDPAIAGRIVSIDNKAYLIAGVMGPSFQFLSNIPGEVTAPPIDLWIPMREQGDLESRSSHNFWALARLKDGVSLQQARSEMRSIAENLARLHPDSNTDMGASVERFRDHVVGSVRPALLMLLGAIGLVLLLACANIANLLLSRAESRRREIAIRQAIGASRGRLIRQTLTESLLLSFSGALAGLGLAHFGIGLVLRLGPANIPLLRQTTLDAQVIVFTAAVSIVVGILFGLAPAVLGTRAHVQASLREAGSRSTIGAPHRILRQILVAGQVALAVVLLIGAGLLIRSFLHVAGLDPGFQSARVLTAFVNLPASQYADPLKQTDFFEEALRRIRELPGVASAAVSNSVPLTGINDQGNFRVEGRPEPASGEDGPQANRPSVSSAYFETMGIHLIEGRLFDQHDRAGSAQVAIVSDLTARTYWPGESPLGKRVGLFRGRSPLTGSAEGGWVWRQIVGVVQSTRHFGIEAPAKPEVYVPHTQAPSSFMVLVVRGHGDVSGLISAIRREIAAVDPHQALFGFQTMEELLANAGARRRFQTTLLAAFAGLALLLAAIGVYGVMAYTVAQRTREIGLRLALGAQPRNVIAMTMRKSLLMTLTGLAAGIAGAVGLSRLLTSLLFGVSPLDGPTYAVVGAGLLLVAGLAAYLPSRGAARIDPLVALREEG
jgi:putative ABC transport system permease protein